MVAGEPFHHHAGEIIFSVQEDVFVGDEYMVQHHQGFLATEFGVAQVDAGTGFHFPGITGLAAVHHVQALGVRGAGKAHGPVPVGFLHGDGGHEDVPVGVDGAGLVHLGPADNDAVRAPFHHMDEHIRIRLFVGCFGAVALGVGHGSVHGQVVVLHIDQEFLEVFVVMGPVFLVHFIGGGEYSVERVHAYAALEAAGRLLAQQPLHLYLLHQVFGGLVQVGEPVDGMAGQAGGGGHQIFVTGILGQGIGHGHTVDGRTDDGMIHPVVDFFPKHIDTGLHFPQAVDVLFRCHQRHDGFLLWVVSGLYNRCLY